ncbi:MAG: DUF4113 domain-containing protein [Pyrinomonadaceae bacterium]
MLDDEKFQQKHNLIKVIDEINQKFGRYTVRFASVKTEGNWKMKQPRKNQSNTTDWNELITVM